MDASPPARRILLLERQPELAALLAAAAERLPAEMVVCATGREALARASEPGLAAALVDLPLEDVRGSDVLSALARAGVPVVAVSGAYRGPACAEQVLAMGATAFFEKPFVVEEVVEVLGHALGGAPAEGPRPAPGPSPDLRPGEAARAPPGSGSLAGVRVPALLAACHTAQATGILGLARGAARKAVLLEGGVPVAATSNLSSERFGAFCVRRGILAPADREALESGLGPGERTADVLLARGAIGERLRADLVAEQVRAIVWSTFEWRDGSYRFALGPLPRQPRLRLRLLPGDLVLEGVMRTATLVDLRRELAPALALAPAPDPAFEVHALGLRPAEARLLAAADGTKSVADLVALAADLPERDALAFLYACRLMGVLDEVERVLASTRRIALT